MKIAIVGDPHLDYAWPATIAKLHAELDAAAPDWVLFPGDIGEAPNVCKHLEQFTDKPYQLAIIAGNHDFYRGSIAGTKANLLEFSKKHRNISYRSGMCDVGMGIPNLRFLSIDGFYDGYHGDFMNSNVWLNDFAFIEEFKGLHTKVDILAKMREIAKSEVATLAQRLAAAFEHNDQVILMMHVPPFPESSVYNGKMSDKNWLPFFSSKLAGDVIMDVMVTLPNKNLTVVAGHSHGSAEFKPLDNVTVITAEAEYGHPKISRILEF